MESDKTDMDEFQRKTDGEWLLVFPTPYYSLLFTLGKSKSCPLP
jgi:hypothetical protein